MDFDETNLQPGKRYSVTPSLDIDSPTTSQRSSSRFPPPDTSDYGHNQDAPTDYQQANPRMPSDSPCPFDRAHDLNIGQQNVGLPERVAELEWRVDQADAVQEELQRFAIKHAAALVDEKRARKAEHIRGKFLAGFMLGIVVGTTLGVTIGGAWGKLSWSMCL